MDLFSQEEDVIKCPDPCVLSSVCMYMFFLLFFYHAWSSKRPSSKAQKMLISCSEVFCHRNRKLNMTLSMLNL
jgi:hypothetical protein